MLYLRQSDGNLKVRVYNNKVSVIMSTLCVYELAQIYLCLLHFHVSPYIHSSL